MSRRHPPSNARDFLKAGEQRLATAKFLCDNDFTLDATYLAGYAVECALKALVLEVTAEGERQNTLERISRGAQMHSFERLKGLLSDLRCHIPLPLSKKFRRYKWYTGIRYETGRTPTGETRGFLKAAKETQEWVREQLS